MLSRRSGLDSRRVHVWLDIFDDGSRALQDRSDIPSIVMYSDIRNIITSYMMQMLKPRGTIPRLEEPEERAPR